MYPNLKLAIFKRGLRQNHLAREVGIHEVALSKIIHGVREASPAQRSRLCAYLNAEESWLFESYVCAPAKASASSDQERKSENEDS